MRCEFFVVFGLSGRKLEHVKPIRITRCLPRCGSGEFAVKMSVGFPDELARKLYPALTATIEEDDIATQGIDLEVVSETLPPQD